MSNLIVNPYTGEGCEEKQRPPATERQSSEQVLPVPELPGPMFEAFEQGNAHARAWIAKLDADERATIPPTVALSPPPSAASTRRAATRLAALRYAARPRR